MAVRTAYAILAYDPVVPTKKVNPRDCSTSKVGSRLPFRQKTCHDCGGKARITLAKPEQILKRTGGEGAHLAYYALPTMLCLCTRRVSLDEDAGYCHARGQHPIRKASEPLIPHGQGRRRPYQPE